MTNIWLTLVRYFTTPQHSRAHAQAEHLRLKEQTKPWSIFN